MKDQQALAERIMPFYEEFFQLLNQNASFELDVKEITVGQFKLKDAEQIKEASRKKAEILDVMVQNNLKMDRLKASLRKLDPGTPFKKTNMFSKLDEVGKTIGTHALDVGMSDVEVLQGLSSVIDKSGFKVPASGISVRGPVDPCWCQGCSGCTGCTTACQASCGNCVGCTGCTGCSGCNDICSTCFGVSVSHPKQAVDQESQE